MAAVNFQMAGSLARITLANPPMNLVSGEMKEGLQEALKSIKHQSPRGLLLLAEGDNFSAGADVKMFLEWSPEEAGRQLSGFIDLIHQIEALPFPTMAAVQGMCLAGGLELALAFDFIWAADNAHFGQVETMIGALPYGGGAQRLAARAGLARAKEIVLGARIYPAAEFEKWGIINRIVPANELHAKSEKFMVRFAETGATTALNGSKQILNAWAYAGMAQADDLNKKLSPTTFNTKDLVTGVNSFLKDGPGKATFTGK